MGAVAEAIRWAVAPESRKARANPGDFARGALYIIGKSGAGTGGAPSAPRALFSVISKMVRARDARHQERTGIN